MRRGALDPSAVEGHAPGARLHEAEDHFHRCRLAAGVAAQQRNDAAPPDLQRKVEMDLHRAVKRVHFLEAEKRFVHAHARLPEVGVSSGAGSAPPRLLWPRKASMTAGSLRTECGEPSAIL